MKLLILGGSGFLSGTLANVATEQGHTVWALTRGQRPVSDGVISLIADRHDESALQQVIDEAGEEWDLVVDCIGYEPADARQDLALFRKRAQHLVFISTDFVYHPARRRFPQSEETDHYLPDGYGGKKRLCELELLNGDSADMGWTVLRPGHIYGPGSLLGCLPNHGRDPDLISKMRAGTTLDLVGGGHFLQQPILASDLAHLILSVHDNPSCNKEIFCVAGPDIIESRMYYEIIAGILGVSLNIGELPVAGFLQTHPDRASFLCHRFYDLSKLMASGLRLPATSMRDGLQVHVASLIN